ncbi:MAG TPA: hypothetical protein VKA67_09145, partial [Verrucomicrobiae bacterium]|nr:hypothetical protein [Verrucomicrobiae bacterium]
MKQIAADTNSASVMGVWDLPRSRQLLKQTLDKLSLAPWRLLRRRLDTNPARLFRPLLDDVIQQPSFLEIRQIPNRNVEVAFAIHLEGQRAALWQTNLAIVLESLTGIQVEPAPKGKHGWSLKKHHAPDFIELARADNWIILGAGREQDSLFDKFVSRLRHHQAPFTALSTNDWLEMQSDLQAATRILWPGKNFPPGLPEISFSINGDGEHVQTRGELTFRQPLSPDLPSWNIPTNFIDGALDSFTAMRGIRPWLESLKSWDNLQAGPPPDQMYFWSLQGLRMLTYFAAPLAEASNAVSRLTDRVLRGGLP